MLSPLFISNRFTHVCYRQDFFAYFHIEMRRRLRISAGLGMLYASGCVGLGVNCNGMTTEFKQV